MGVCCLIMDKILIQVLYNQILNMSNIKYCFKSECYSSRTRMTVAQCPNMDRTVKLIGNSWDLRVECGYKWYARDLYMIKLFEWSLYEKSIQVILSSKCRYILLKWSLMECLWRRGDSINLKALIFVETHLQPEEPCNS